MMHFRPLAAIAALWLSLVPATAQSPYDPAIVVNDDAITYFEIDQRIRMLELFSTPGDLPDLAREQLVEDRLKRQALRRAGLRITDEALREQLEAFAARADQPYDSFVATLAANGIAEQSLRDFVEIGVSWRDYVRSRYDSVSAISDRELQLGLINESGTGTSIEVLLSEIIIPAPPDRAAEANAIAEQISAGQSTAAFEAAARQYSALPSRDRGGRLDWLPIDNYPGAIRGIILDLDPGEVTRPLPIPNGVALFQLRAVREVAEPVTPPASIDFAVLSLPGGEAGAAQAAQIAARVDTCDDLYTAARGVPPEQLVRADLAPAEIPDDIGIALARLDFGETTLAPSGDGTLRLVMLCARTPELPEGQDAEGVRNQLRSQRLSSIADLLLAELRAEATIRSFE